MSIKTHKEEQTFSDSKIVACHVFVIIDLYNIRSMVPFEVSRSLAHRKEPRLDPQHLILSTTSREFILSSAADMFERFACALR